MRQLIDKLFLFLLCTLCFFSLFLGKISNGLTIFILLITIILSCLQSTYRNRSLTVSFSIFFAALCLIYHPFFVFLPVMLFDIYVQKIRKLTITGILFSTLSAFFINEGYGIVLLILLHVLSYWLNIQSAQIDIYEKKLIELRDTSTENKLLLEQKNKAILENQTNQIYTATLKERNRIAREIHDNTGHLLTRSILQAGALKTINKDETLNQHFESLQDTLNQAMTNIRKSVHDLHDESVDLKLAIEELMAPIENPEITLEYSMNTSVPKEIKYQFLAIIKESIHNTVRHSNATQLRIYVIEHPGFYQLLIEDNGTNISKDFSSGIGLINMEERVKALNGTFKINTQNGFHIFISIMK